MDVIISEIRNFVSQNSNLISQIFGAIVCVFAVASMQTKNIKYTMLFQLLCNGLGMISYLLLDGFSGFGIYLIATLQSLVFFLLRLFDKKVPVWVYPIIFTSYVGCSLLTFKGITDIVPMIAAQLCALALIQKKTSNYRIVILLNGSVWIIYDLLVGSYGMLASHIITVASALFGIIRLDVLKKRS